MYQSKFFSTYFIFCTLFLSLSGTVSAKDLYVSTTGHDYWCTKGTKDDPFASIIRATWKCEAGVICAAPGDTIYLRGGTYELKRGEWINTGGTSEDPLTIRPYGDGEVILDGTNISTDNFILGSDQSHLIIEGITIRNSPGQGIIIWSTNGIPITDVVVRNNTIHDCKGAAIYVGRDDNTFFDSIMVENNHLHDNVQENKDRNWLGGWHPVLGIDKVKCENEGCIAVTVRSNHIHENYGEGINIIRSKNIHVIHNEVYDNYSVNLYIDNGVKTRHEANLVYSTGNKNYYRDFYNTGDPNKRLPAVGISIANEWLNSQSDDTWNDSSENIIVNNLFINNRSAFYYGSYNGFGGPPQQNKGMNKGKCS